MKIFLSSDKKVKMISFLIVLVIIGVCLYLLNTLVPMDAKIKTVINVVVVVAVLLYTLQFFGIVGDLSLPHHYK
jgi:hypothetical protein